MIFIRISKIGVTGIVCAIIVVLVLGVGIVDREIELGNCVENIENLREEKSNLLQIIGEKEEKIAKIEKENIELSEELKKYEELNIPNIDVSKKTYMDYKKICKESTQGNIVYGVEAWTDNEGLRRWNDYYCVALGSYYGNVGDKFLVVTDKGNNYRVIKADEKANIHTDSSNRYTIATKCMMEWVVETSKLNKFVKNSGNINNIEKVSGNIIKIIKIRE